MSRVQIFNVGDFGIMKDTDVPPHELPPEAWSDGNNMRFRDKKAVKFNGHDQVFSQMTLAPYWLLSVPSGSSNYWLAAGLEAVQAIQTTNMADITRSSAAYSASSDGRWNGGCLGNIAILNNGQDIPQYWATASLTQLLQDLSNWPSGYRAKVIRPFKNMLIALGITTDFGGVSETYYPSRVLASQPADPGTIPDSWDASDETKDVVDTQFSDEDNGEILDALGLGDNLIIYKEGSTYLTQYIGGQFVYKFTRIFESQGILTTNCVAALPQGKGHFVCTNELDIVIHDGQTAQSLLDQRMRQWLMVNVDADNYYRSFCVANQAAKEMWFCFPENGSMYCSKAIVYNIVTKQLGLRELSNVVFGASGRIDEAGSQEIWDDVDTVWDDDDKYWDQRVTTQFARGILVADPSQSKLFRMDNTETFDGANISAYLERTGIAIIARDRMGQPQLDFTRNKLIRRVWPKISGAAVTIKMGSQDTVDGTVTWTSEASFDPSTDTYIDPDPPPNGRLPAIRIEANGSASFSVSGYDMDIELLGEL